MKTRKKNLTTQIKVALIGSAGIVLAAIIGLLPMVYGGDSEATISVEILQPADNSNVPEVADVDIKTGIKNPQVWCIVHPTNGGDYWVQSKAIQLGERLWRVRAYFGDSGTESGTGFEIRAVCNPTATIKRGDKLTNWPSGQALSSLRTVSRK